MTDLDKVKAEILRYEHALIDISASQDETGEIRLMLSAKSRPEAVHSYSAPIHPRDVAHSQFPWTFQRYLYDCIHDYMVELFVKTPQTRDKS